MKIHKFFRFSKKNKVNGNLIEFILLFSAITLGFMVDNFREDYIENTRAKELITGMHEDVINDTIGFNSFLEKRKELRINIQKLVDDIEDHGIITDNPDQFFLFAFAMLSWDYYEPIDANLEQVVNSGSLRYFEDKDLVKQVAVVKAQIKILKLRLERERHYWYNYIQPVMINNFNFKPFDKYYMRNNMNFYEMASKMKSGDLSMNTNELLYIDNKKDKVKYMLNLFRHYDFILRSSLMLTYESYLYEVEKLEKLLRNNLK